jgi:hypothetical protein
MLPPCITIAEHTTEKAENTRIPQSSPTKKAGTEIKHLPTASHDAAIHCLISFKDQGQSAKNPKALYANMWS